MPHNEVVSRNVELCSNGVGNSCRFEGAKVIDPVPAITSSAHLGRKFNSKFIRIAALFFVGVILASCSRSDPPTARAAGQQIMPVGVATAEKKDMPVYLSGLGSVNAFNTVSVRPRVDGQLLDVNFKEGQFVNQGDLLVVIDPRPYEVALSQAQAALFRDQAQLKDAQCASADQLEGVVRADQAAIDNAKLNLVYCRVTAPISGRIGLRLIDKGNMVHASDANPLLVITQLQPISVLFTLPEDQLQ